MTRPPAVFLDRDGVLNASAVVDGVPVPPRRAEDFALLPGVAEACRSLADAGLVLVVVTNQPDVARGALAAADLDAIHAAAARRAADRARLGAARTTTPTAARAASRGPG